MSGIPPNGTTPVRGIPIPPSGTSYAATAAPTPSPDVGDDAAATLRLLQRPVVRWVLGALVAAAIAAAGWYVGNKSDIDELKRSVEERPTQAEAEAIAKGVWSERMSAHAREADPHPPLSTQIDKIANLQARINTSVTEQAVTLTNIEKTLEVISAELRRMARRRDR